MKYSHLPRVYFSDKLAEKQLIIVKDEVFHYLKNVLRLRILDKFRLFNSSDGEFLVTIKIVAKNYISLTVNKLLRKAVFGQKLILVTSIIKQNRFIEIIKAATQLGCSKIIPLISNRTQYAKINRDKLVKSIIQSVAQSERFDIPELTAEIKLEDFYQNYHQEQIIFACETENETNTLNKLHDISAEPYLLIGPEGGFSNDEINLVKNMPRAHTISLGPNILRSEVAATALISYITITR